MVLPMDTPEAISCQQHPSVQTRLRCTECDAPICPRCMVMYEVGFKCPSCAKKRPSHSEKLESWHYAITIAGCTGAGQLYGWLHPWLSTLFGGIGIFGIPVVCWLIAYALGKALGKLIQKLLKHKHHPYLIISAFLGALAGLLWQTPYATALSSALEAVFSFFSGLGTSIEFYLLGPALFLVSGFLFLRGLLEPFQKPFD